MTGFKKNYLSNKPLTYYIVINSENKGRDWMIINPIVTDQPVFAPGGVIAIFSNLTIDDTKSIGIPLELICLVCFFHILRRDDRISSALLDDKYRLTIKPWRAPCETTAIYTDNDETYYLEGCGKRGVFWKSRGERPKTEPPFVSCGAFDTNAGCWGTDCPQGSYFEDDAEPFDLM